MAPVNRNLQRLPPWLQKFLGVPEEKIPDKAARTLKRHSGSQYFEQSPHIAEDDWTSLEKAYGLHTVEEVRAVELPVCERPLFESVIGMTIMLNAICMALEVDLSEKGSPPSKRMLWVVIDLMFCTVFSCEIGFRIHCLGLAGFFMHARYLFDVLLVGINVVDTTVQLAGNGSTGLQGLTALRLLRLFKIVKILRVVSHIKELNLLAKGLASALKSLQWVSLMLALVTFVMSIMFKTIIGTQCDEQEFKEVFIYHFGTMVDPVEKCEEYWGTIFRCMYTLYQVTTLESWSQVIARPIWDIRPHYVFLILVFQLVTTFGLLNIVVAAVVEGTMNSTDEMVVENTTAKETVCHLDILREIFHRSCNEETKEVSQANLLPVLHDSAIRRKLLLLEIAYDDPAQIFRILDTNERGSVNIKELTQGFMRMRGTAKSKDLMAVRALVYRLSHEVNGKLDTLLSTSGGKDASNLSNLNEDLNRRFDRFEEEMRGQIGLLSEAIALNAPAAAALATGKSSSSLGELLTARLDRFEAELRGRMGMLEGRLSRLMTTSVMVSTGAPDAMPAMPTMPAAQPTSMVNGRPFNWEDATQISSVNAALQETYKQELLRAQQENKDMRQLLGNPQGDQAKKNSFAVTSGDKQPMLEYSNGSTVSTLAPMPRPPTGPPVAMNTGKPAMGCCWTPEECQASPALQAAVAKPSVGSR